MHIIHTLFDWNNNFQQLPPISIFWFTVNLFVLYISLLKWTKKKYFHDSMRWEFISVKTICDVLEVKWICYSFLYNGWLISHRFNMLNIQHIVSISNNIFFFRSHDIIIMISRLVYLGGERKKNSNTVYEVKDTHTRWTINELCYGMWKHHIRTFHSKQ